MPIIQINKQECLKYKKFFTCIKAALLYELTRPADLFMQRCKEEDLDRQEPNYLGRAKTLFVFLDSEGFMNRNSTNKPDGSDLFTFQLDKELNPNGADIFWSITDCLRDDLKQMVDKTNKIATKNKELIEELRREG